MKPRQCATVPTICSGCLTVVSKINHYGRANLLGWTSPLLLDRCVKMRVVLRHKTRGRFWGVGHSGKFLLVVSKLKLLIEILVLGGSECFTSESFNMWFLEKIHWWFPNWNSAWYVWQLDPSPGTDLLHVFSHKGCFLPGPWTTN